MIDSVGPVNDLMDKWGGPPNAYGISFSHLKRASNSAHPAPQRCLAGGNLIQNIPLWSGLDTHSGIGITFAHNRVYKCKIGIHAGVRELYGRKRNGDLR